MLSRRPAPRADPQAEVRVLQLLARGRRGGWVPPADDGPLPVEAAPDPETSWSPRHAEPGAEVPPATVVPDPPVTRSYDSPATASEPPALPGVLSSALPATLRGGRLDPGHRGAVALLLVCVLAALVAAAVVWRARPQEVPAPTVESAGVPLPGAPSASPTADPGQELVVAVAGTVVQPGIVRLPAGSRVDDAVRAAGGLAPGGSYGLLNLARKLVDGEQVLVGVEPPPGTGDAGPAGPGAVGSGGAGAGGLLDLNAATASDLDQLPGIGPVLAERIVAWRTENGRFASVDQLREVTGIGEAKYADLEDRVTV